MNSSTHIALFFVLLWSSAFFAFQFSSPYVEPATFVVIRAAITAFILYILVIFNRSSWPRSWIDCVPCIAVGVLMHGVYGGGVFASVYHGIDIRLCALILSLQPIVTVLFAAIFHRETLTFQKILGILAGFLGVSVMILNGNTSSPQRAVLDGVNSSSGNESFAIALCLLALLAISSAAIVQKKFCSDIEPLPGAFIQFTSAVYFMLPFALMFETMQVSWELEFVLSLSWLIFGVSIGAMSLLMTLIRNDKPSAVANLFYLITPVVAILSCVLFGEQLSLLALAGMLLCLSGVYIVNYVSPVKNGQGLNLHFKILTASGQILSNTPVYFCVEPICVWFVKQLRICS